MQSIAVLCSSSQFTLFGLMLSWSVASFFLFNQVVVGRVYTGVENDGGELKGCLHRSRNFWFGRMDGWSR